MRYSVVFLLLIVAGTGLAGLASRFLLSNGLMTGGSLGADGKTLNGLLLLRRRVRSVDDDGNDDLLITLHRRGKGKKGKQSGISGGGGASSSTVSKTKDTASASSSLPGVPPNTPQTSSSTSTRSSQPGRLESSRPIDRQQQQTPGLGPSIGSSSTRQATRRLLSQTQTSKPGANSQRGRPVVPQGVGGQGQQRSPSPLSSQRAEASPKRKEMASTQTHREGSMTARQGGRTLVEASQLSRSRSNSPTSRYRDDRSGASVPIAEQLAEVERISSQPVVKPTSFATFVNHNKQLIAQAKKAPSTPIQPPAGVVENAADAKSKAQDARAEANQKYNEAKQVATSHRASSPTTNSAMLASTMASMEAVKATAAHSRARQQAGRDLLGTTENDAVQRHLKTAAREFKRAQVRQAHALAFDKQHVATSLAENAEKKKKGAKRPAEVKANSARIAAGNLAKDYYRHFDQYSLTRAEFSSGSDSNDEERPLRDNPRSNRRQ